MKKTFVSSLILVSLLTPSLGAVQAQTAASSEQVEELRSTLISLLMQMIAQLQEQINQILANQQAQMSNSTGGYFSSSSSTVSTGSNGSGGTGGAPSTTVVPEPTPDISVSPASCTANGDWEVSFTVNPIQTGASYLQGEIGLQAGNRATNSWVTVSGYGQVPIPAYPLGMPRAMQNMYSAQGKNDYRLYFNYVDSGHTFVVDKAITAPNCLP